MRCVTCLQNIGGQRQAQSAACSPSFHHNCSDQFESTNVRGISTRGAPIVKHIWLAYATLHAVCSFAGVLSPCVLIASMLVILPCFNVVLYSTMWQLLLGRWPQLGSAVPIDRTTRACQLDSGLHLLSLRLKISCNAGRW